MLLCLVDFGTVVPYLLPYPFIYCTDLKLFSVVQYTFILIRILYKLKRRTMVSVSSLMHSLGWLKFRLFCKFRLLCITHRSIYRASPKYLAIMITIRTDYRPRRVGLTIMLHQPITATVYAESAFAVAAPKCWNALQMTSDLSTESEHLFKRKVYHYFIYL